MQNANEEAAARSLAAATTASGIFKELKQELVDIKVRQVILFSFKIVLEWFTQ
jgi:hypothetical protein